MFPGINGLIGKELVAFWSDVFIGELKCIFSGVVDTSYVAFVNDIVLNSSLCFSVPIAMSAAYLLDGTLS